MSFNPKVSIIIPVYNGSNYLREALDSALAQTYKNIEIIVVNDGSNDEGKTEAIAKSYGDRIRYFSKGNGGVSSALNFGIRKAEGNYISWLSHDDAYMPNKIEEQVNHVRTEDNPNAVILYSDYEVMDENSNFVRVHKINPVEPEYLLYDLLTTWPVHGCTTLIPKACFGEVGLFNENNKTVQDYEMWFRFFKKGYRFKYIPEALTKFRVHAKQDSLLKPRAGDRGRFYLFDKLSGAMVDLTHAEDSEGSSKRACISYSDKGK